ncbi:lactosylceramide 4-alpha-galactosyltransferase-like isoform X2 [Ostrinia furnacalis]|uniref:lactosylceramide 4-alpha-galactosyltransferase-like isoform X2 n=1 Tax=Ostrinia furnacalis TaxID=93504 RepID=UPI00103CF84A|nr:lactosylceramide 4-alpha-galactosyltransferase-like isoform X2 [Ostrinia furnacalis]
MFARLANLMFVRNNRATHVFLDLCCKKCSYKTIISVLITGIIIFILKIRDSPEMYIIKWNMTENISCHYSTEDDALPLVDETFNPPEKSIFFHETSCRGGLSSRQACGVESAAKAHPDWQVNVFFSGPVSDFILKRSFLAKLLKYKNVKLMRIHLQEYAKGTPLESLVAASPYKKSAWRIEHTSDVLRYLTLYKYGGVYMDSDFVVVKPFDDLEKNWSGRESITAVVSGVMSFSRDSLGRQMAAATVENFKKNYNPNYWGYNGPGVITRVVKEMCFKTKKKKWIHGCNGFKVYDPEVFYPVYYKQNRLYFEAGRNLTTSEKTYAHHMWNHLTMKYSIPKTSPYAQLAKQYCPTVYEMYGDSFGV